MSKGNYITVGVHVSRKVRAAAVRCSKRAKAKSLSSFLAAVIAEKVLSERGREDVATEIENRALQDLREENQMSESAKVG